MATLSPPLRADAAANRQRLVEVARAAFADDPEVSLNFIAKTAEVGAGTLYRHFPTRDALVLAANRAEIDSLVTLAHSLADELPPLEALRTWCHSLIGHVRRQRGFAQVLQAALSEEEQARTFRPIADAISHLLDRCAAAGMIGTDIDALDLQLLFSFMWQIRTDEGEARGRRGVDLVIRGLQER